VYIYIVWSLLLIWLFRSSHSFIFFRLCLFIFRIIVPFWKYTTLYFYLHFIWVRKLDSNSLTKTKNWRGRNEVTETSGRLHYLYHKTNDYIRRELRITGILDKIDEYRRNWFQHLQRMPQKRIPLKSYHCGPQGRRTIGRPKKRWRE